MTDTRLDGREILLCVTGGIACYKAVEVLRLLKTAGAEVSVVMTAHAREFVGPLTFQTLSNRPVGTSLFDLDQESRIGHINLAERAELALVTPCTANFAAKLRAGLADDLASSVLLATGAPIYLALAMNDRMLAHAATRENLEVLRSRGVHLIPPEEGFLAEGKIALGRLADPAAIVERVAAHFGNETSSDEKSKGGILAGKRILVTAGPTREAIDPVRFLSNRSSGRMGFALAEACRDAGAGVTLVHGPSALAVPPVLEAIAVTTAEEMRQAVHSRREAQDALILAAAVSDYRPKSRSAQKIKRGKSPRITLELEPNPDIAAEVGAAKSKGQVLVIFAAESEDLLANARKKLKAKNADLVVANDITEPGSGFDGAENRVTLLRPGRGEDIPDAEHLPLQDKHTIARRIVSVMADLMSGS